MILQLFLIAAGKSIFVNPESFGDLESISTFTNGTLMITNIFHSVLIIGLYIGIYFKLKTQKY